MSTMVLNSVPDSLRRYFPGIFASVVAGVAASFLSTQYHAPVMLMALLIGIGMNFLAHDSACAEGVNFTARTVLRIGVALLGLRITVDQIAGLGWEPVLAVIFALVLTIGLSMLAAKWLGFRSTFGMLSGAPPRPGRPVTSPRSSSSRAWRCCYP